MKKKLQKIAACMLAAAITASLALGLTACVKDDGGKDNGHDGPMTHYNIIFTLATVPPVLASLESIESGYATYAMIERGSTYSGIGATEGLNFVNLGFDVKNNTSAGFSEEQFQKTVDCIKELNENDNGYSFFHIYLRDADPMFGFALAANAELDERQYELVLCEDGSASYVEFNKTYIDGKKVTAEHDEPYETYLANVAEMKKKRDAILSKHDNTLSGLSQEFNYGCAAAALEHVVWRLQDSGQILSALKAVGSDKLLSALGAEGYTAETDYHTAIRNGSISQKVNALPEAKRTQYLSLMYGSYYADTYGALTRTKLADGTAVPAKKLVFIGSRVKGSPALASDETYGIGGAKTAADVPATYAALDEKYKTPLLFGTEGDYAIFLNALADASNYPTPATEAQKDAVRVQCFNYYIDYMFTMKFTHAMYGADYDIIVKGHPSEVLGSSSTWTNHYTAEAAGEEAYTYDLLMDNLVSDFHKSDSVGKFIGMVPYGTAAENLAYLGADLSIGGLDSSTYKGYDPNVDVKFLLNLVDTDITANANVGERYTAGTLQNHNADGSAAQTAYYNAGYILKALSEYYEGRDDAARKATYDGLLAGWLAAQSGTDVTPQGTVVKS